MRSLHNEVSDSRCQSESWDCRWLNEDGWAKNVSSIQNSVQKSVQKHSPTSPLDLVTVAPDLQRRFTNSGQRLWNFRWPWGSRRDLASLPFLLVWSDVSVGLLLSVAVSFVKMTIVSCQWRHNALQGVRTLLSGEWRDSWDSSRVELTSRLSQHTSEEWQERDNKEVLMCWHWTEHLRHQHHIQHLQHYPPSGLLCWETCLFTRRQHFFLPQVLMTNIIPQ